MNFFECATYIYVHGQEGSSFKRGPACLSREAGFATFIDGILGVCFKIAGNGMTYANGTENFLIFLFVR